MRRFFRIGLCLVYLAAASFPALGQTADCSAVHPEYKTEEARATLNQGVFAYKGAHYDDAIADFQRAMDLDPCLPMARAYLGTAFAQEVVPGLETPENLAVAQRAIDVFKGILTDHVHDVNSMKQLASIYYNVKSFEDAKEWQKHVLVEDPKDAEAAYTIGVIDWTLAHQHAMQALLAVGLIDDGLGNRGAPTQVMKAIQSANATLVPEAIEYLNRATEVRPNYDDAMQYLNLVYRRKADLDWDDAAAREEDLAQAKAWVEKAMQMRKANAEIWAKGQTAQQP